jgi:hypothetical protein
LTLELVEGLITVFLGIDCQTKICTVSTVWVSFRNEGITAAKLKTFQVKITNFATFLPFMGGISPNSSPFPDSQKVQTK